LRLISSSELWWADDVEVRQDTIEMDVSDEVTIENGRRHAAPFPNAL
jgi:hypothetical protein